MTSADRPTGRNEVYAGVALQLRRNGYSPIPLADKVPAVAGWPGIFCERVPQIAEIERDWCGAQRGAVEFNGVGVAVAGGLVIIDIDLDDAVDRVLELLPHLRSAPACAGARGRKIFCRAADRKCVRARNVTGASTGGAVEILAWHRQGVVPPTVHPKTHQPYTWLDERMTLLTTPLHRLPLITDTHIAVLSDAFPTASSKVAVPKKCTPAAETPVPVATTARAPDFLPPARWWQTSANREKIEELVRLFGVVHRAARDRGGRIEIKADGTNAEGLAHRAEIIDINATAHWRHVVRVINDVLGSSEEALWLHIEVSNGNATLGLPGGPETYDEVGNKRFFDSVVAPQTFESKSGRKPRTLRSLYWWARQIEGRPPASTHVRRQGRVKPWHQALARLRTAGVEVNVGAARVKAHQVFRAGSKQRAIVDEALDLIARGDGRAELKDIAGFAAARGATVRTVQYAFAGAERAGILVRTRGSEGAKSILLTVPVLVESARQDHNADGIISSSLQSGIGGGFCVCEVASAAAVAQPLMIAANNGPRRRGRNRAQQLPPFGLVQRPGGCDGLLGLTELLSEALQGTSTVATLLRAGILPPEALAPLLQIAEQNSAGRAAGSKWLRHIAGEIGELILREPAQWPGQLQGALNDVAARLAKPSVRETPIRWARSFAETLGYVHERAGRLTPMAIAALAAQRSWVRRGNPE